MPQDIPPPPTQRTARKRWRRQWGAAWDALPDDAVIEEELIIVKASDLKPAKKKAKKKASKKKGS